MYPGYEPDEVTPLPEPLQAKEILLTVINAQQDLRKKVTNYKLDQIKQSCRYSIYSVNMSKTFCTKLNMAECGSGKG